MQPILKKIGALSDSSFQLLIVNEPVFYPSWHFHPEFEIILIQKGIGNLYIGDSIEKFEPGNLFLIGPNLPHLYESSNNYEHQMAKAKAKANVIYFKSDFGGSEFFRTPEAFKVNEMLGIASGGIKFKGERIETVIKEMNDIVNKTGFERVISLLTILHHLSLHQNIIVLSKPYSNKYSKKELRINQVYNYVQENFHGGINLSQAAKIACMNPNAFCRYFKQRTNCTFNQFVTEFRISFARKLLIETNATVKEIAYESGYNSVPNFMLQFKKNTKLTPQEYRQIQNHKMG